MAVYKQKKSRHWWYKFMWNGESIRESTKQSNKRVAEQMEAARKTQLAKGEVGIRDRKAVPSLTQFMQHSFLPFVETTMGEEPNTVKFYGVCTANLLGSAALSDCKLNAIDAERVTAFIAGRQQAGMAVSTINRELSTLRRALHLAS